MPVVLSQQEFIRKLLAKKGQISWLLGAGTSVSANLPTAQDIIWDLKKKYYCSEENQNFQSNDIQVAPVKEKIQSYFDSKGHAVQWAEEEYSYYFELLFGKDYSQQRDYLQASLNTKNISISAGQRVLAALMSSGFIPCTFSTNFDEVVEESYSKVVGSHIAPFHIDGSYAAIDALNANNLPMLVKLHGDFRFKSLKNLEEDLKQANENLGACFVQAGNRYGLFVVGYSGRDDSVMSLIDDVLGNSNPFPHGLYWAVLKNSDVNPRVAAIVEKAQSKGVEAAIVEIDDFVGLMSSIWKQNPDKTDELEKAVNANQTFNVKIPLPEPGRKDPLIRFNTLPIQILPQDVYRIKLDKALDWKEYGKIRGEHRGKIISFRDEDIFAWGRVDHIKNAFGRECEVKEWNISDKLENLSEHKALKGALEEALCRALVDSAGFNYKTKYHNKYLTLPIVSDDEEGAEKKSFPYLEKIFDEYSGQVPNVQVTRTDKESGEEKHFPLSWSEAVQVTITQLNGNHVAAFRPDIWISPKNERKLAKEFIYKKISGDKRNTRKNDVLDSILSAWLDTVIGSPEKISLMLTAFKDAELAGKAQFQLLTRTSYSKRG